MIVLLITQNPSCSEFTNAEAVVAVCFMALLGWGIHCLTRDFD